jgi:MFS family permease
VHDCRGPVAGDPNSLGRGCWLALVSTPTVSYSTLIGPFVVAGVGMALFFAPVANVVLSAVRRDEEGQASGANNAIRELGGVFGVAVLAAIFSQVGGYQSAEAFSEGMNTAVLVGAALVAVGAVAAFAIPDRRRRQEVPVGQAEPLADAA